MPRHTPTPEVPPEERQVMPETRERKNVLRKIWDHPVGKTLIVGSVLAGVTTAAIALSPSVAQGATPDPARAVPGTPIDLKKIGDRLMAGLKEKGAALQEGGTALKGRALEYWKSLTDRSGTPPPPVVKTGEGDAGAPKPKPLPIAPAPKKLPDPPTKPKPLFDDA